MNESDFLWQVVYVDKRSNYKAVEGLFCSEEEACRRRDELVKERRQADSFDIYPLENDWAYKIQVTTRQDVQRERRKKREQLMTEARERFRNHCDDHFADCCRLLLKWMTEHIRDISEEDMVQRAQEGKPLYAPWQDFHGDSKVFALMLFDVQKSMTLTGQFASRSLEGTIYVRIRQFRSREAFLSWVECLDAAVDEFARKMREEGCEENF